MNDVSATLESGLSADAATSTRKELLGRLFGRFITASEILMDFFTVQAAYLLSYWLYTGPLERASPQSFVEFLAFSFGVGLIYVIVLDRVGLYRREMSLLNVKELRGIFYVGLYAAAAIFAISFYIRFASLSRIMLSTAIVIAPVALYFQRQIFYRLHLFFHQKGWSRKRVLIFGAGAIGTHIAKRLFESPALGLLPVGFLDDDESRIGMRIKWSGVGPRDGLPVLGGDAEISQAVRRGIDQLLIALPSASFDRNQKLVEQCIQAGLDYGIVPNTYEKFIQNVETYEIGGIPLIRRRVSHVSLYYLVMKRMIDWVFSLFFIILLSPFWIVFAVLIKWDSKGPVIFKQKRVGLRGREFSFYKFRTMYVDAPAYTRSPSDPSDSRITRVGRWLRRTSLDELPQLFNVFRGDMSLVGPRPEMPFIVETYSPLQRQRLLAKPGITGVWQISAVRGEPIHANIEYDLFYLENRSILLDVAIILKTILSVIKGVGAI